MQKKMRLCGMVAVLALLAGGSFARAQEATSQAAGDTAVPAVVAVVQGEEITAASLRQAVVQAARAKFYHGAVEDEELAALRREVLEKLIVDRLLVAEAERRGIQVDTETVEGRLSAYDQQYKDSEQWQRMRESVLPALRAELNQKSLLVELEKAVRMVDEPTEEDLRAYHASHPELFTEPVQNRVSVILLRVDPSSTGDVWVAAGEEAVRIHEQLMAGADFAAMAKLRSSDESAPNGGDMGYLHDGMLAPEAQKVVDELQPGEIAKPVRLLQGIAILKLIDRTEPVRHTLDEVRERARGLYLRDQADKRWAALKKDLRATADVTVNLAAEEPKTE